MKIRKYFYSGLLSLCLLQGATSSEPSTFKTVENVQKSLPPIMVGTIYSSRLYWSWNYENKYSKTEKCVILRIEAVLRYFVLMKRVQYELRPSYNCHLRH